MTAKIFMGNVRLVALSCSRGDPVAPRVAEVLVRASRFILGLLSSEETLLNLC